MMNTTPDAVAGLNRPPLLTHQHQQDVPPTTAHDLYDPTRSVWKLGPNRENIEFALSVYGGVAREVYEISGWAPGGSTVKLRDAHGRADSRSDRFEFVGQIADDAVRDRYLGRSVAHYFKPGAQNPIMHVNC